MMLKTSCEPQERVVAKFNVRMSLIPECMLRWRMGKRVCHQEGTTRAWRTLQHHREQLAPALRPPIASGHQKHLQPVSRGRYPMWLTHSGCSCSLCPRWWDLFRWDTFWNQNPLDCKGALRNTLVHRQLSSAREYERKFMMCRRNSWRLWCSSKSRTSAFRPTWQCR